MAELEGSLLNPNGRRVRGYAVVTARLRSGDGSPGLPEEREWVRFADSGLRRTPPSPASLRGGGVAALAGLPDAESRRSRRDAAGSGRLPRAARRSDIQARERIDAAAGRGAMGRHRQSEAWRMADLSRATQRQSIHRTRADHAGECRGTGPEVELPDPRSARPRSHPGRRRRGDVRDHGEHRHGARCAHRAAHLGVQPAAVQGTRRRCLGRHQSRRGGARRPGLPGHR